MQVAGTWPKPASVSKVSASLALPASGSVVELLWQRRATYVSIQPCVIAVATKLPGGLRARADNRHHPAYLIAIMRILDIPQTGKLGTTVSVRTRYGQIRRRYAVPRKAPSPAQISIRETVGRVRFLWRTLTDEQRDAWTISGQGVSSQPCLGQSGSLPGYLLFMKINTTLAYQGLPPALTPTERPTFGDNPVRELVITNTGSVIDLKLSVPTAPAADIVVLGTHPRSPGVTFAKHFTILGRLPVPEAGYSTITQLYVDRYGVPPAGMRVFIRTRQMLNGWEDLPKETTAVVPR